MAEDTARPLLCCVLAASSRGPLDEAALPGGPFGRRCELLTAASLVAVIAPLHGSTEVAQVERPRVADLLAYGRIVDHVHAHGRRTTIPIRFGCLFADRAAVEQHLGERAAEYQRLLAQLHDAVEVSVRMPLPPEPAPPAVPPQDQAQAQAQAHGAAAGAGVGAAYLRAQQARLLKEKQREAHAAREAEWLRAALAAGTRGQAVSLKPLSPGEPAVSVVPAVSVALLVGREQLGALRQRITELAAQSGRALTLHGPFPPYSFVQLEPRAP